MTATFTVATEKFRYLLGAGLLSKGSDTLLPNVVAHLEPDGVVTIADMSLDVIAVNLKTSAKFFKSYNVDTPLDVVLTSSLFAIVDKKFKNVEEITVKIDDKKIYVNSVKKGPSYDEDLVNINKPPFSIKLAKTEYGVLPAKAVESAHVIAQVVVSSMENMLEAKDYVFVSEEPADGISPLALYVGDGAKNYRQPIEIVGQPVKQDELREAFNSGYFDRLLSNLSENAYMVVDENAISFAKTTDDLFMLMMLSVQEKDTE